MPGGNRTPEATIGCGSLILIALIVLIFGKSNTSDLEREVKGLRSEVKELKESVDGQSTVIRGLREDLEKSKAK